MKRIEWSAPAEVASAECDCFWHRRIFSHLALGDDLVTRQRLALERTVIRTDYDDGSIGWQMTLVVEGARFLVFRTVAAGGVRFDAVADGVARLAAHNDHSRRTKDGGDPTLIWNLPEQVGRAAFPPGSQLIVWAEAWWWHLDARGRDPLRSAEWLGAVSDADPAWSLPG